MSAPSTPTAPVTIVATASATVWGACTANARDGPRLVLRLGAVGVLGVGDAIVVIGMGDVQAHANGATASICASPFRARRLRRPTETGLLGGEAGGAALAAVASFVRKAPSSWMVLMSGAGNTTSSSCRRRSRPASAGCAAAGRAGGPS